MNWSKAKTILIILFLFTDCFLFVTFAKAIYKSNSVNSEVIASAAELLNSNGIEISNDIIPLSLRLCKYAEADNVISDYAEFAEKILGEKCEKIGGFSYKSERGEISFDGDRFEFSANTPANDAESTSGHGEVAEGEGEIPNGDKGEKYAKKTAKNFLKSVGFDLSNSVEIELKSGGNDGDFKSRNRDFEYVFTFKSKVNGLTFFDNFVTVTVTGGQISAVSGTWFNQNDTTGKNYDIRPITSPLIDLLQLENRPEKISAIDFGYTVSDKGEYHKSAVLVPIWVLTEEDGTDHVFDARSIEAY